MLLSPPSINCKVITVRLNFSGAVDHRDAVLRPLSDVLSVEVRPELERIFKNNIKRFAASEIKAYLGLSAERLTLEVQSITSGLKS